MESSVSKLASIRFNGWEIRPTERVLLVANRPVQVGSRAFEVLLALVARSGMPLSKSELLDAAWPGVVVEENNISVQVATLRKLLGPKAITTVPGIGYRLSSLSEDGSKVSDLTGTMPRAIELHQLYGRGDDVNLLVEKLRSVRLLSIVGTGGVGKTSLAMAVAACIAASDGKAPQWIDLTPLHDAAQLPPIVAKALGIEVTGIDESSDFIVSALAGARAVIVLDNCEHLVAGIASFVSQLISKADGLRLLTTSREPLHLAGEVIYRLWPLEVPGADATLAEASVFSAVRLLVDRASAADRHFTLDESTLTFAIDICRKLDGLPLAIEMAAARIATLGLQTVHQQLDHRLFLLSGPRWGTARHHTLHSTFDWSYGLLTSTEQKVYRRLQPFVDGFSGTMACQISRDPDGEPDSINEWRTMAVLSALVDKSLVQRSSSSLDRFFLLESAREYARTCLEATGELQTMRRRHAHLIASRFDQSGSQLEELPDAHWIARYLPERHNALAALAWACEAREPDVLANLVAGVARMNTVVHLPAEMVRLQVPLDVLDDAMPTLRAAACLELGWAHYFDGSRELGTRLSMRALDDFKAIGDVTGTYRALAQLIRLYESRPRMLEQASTALRLFQEIDDQTIPLRTRLTCTIWAGPQYGSAWTLVRLQELEDLAHRAGYDALAAICRLNTTDELLVERRFEDAIVAVDTFLRAGEARPRVRALLMSNQALALVQLDRFDAAYLSGSAAMRAFPRVTHIVMTTFALAAARQGRHADAAMLSSYAERIRCERDESADPAEAAAILETSQRLGNVFDMRRITELATAASRMTAGEILALTVPGPV